MARHRLFDLKRTWYVNFDQSPYGEILLSFCGKRKKQRKTIGSAEMNENVVFV
jgi:hypothetical protein